MKLAILCSGQGAQHPDMFRLNRDTAPLLFEHAAALLGASVHTWLDGEPVTDIATGIDKLARQIAQPVRWDACLAACIEEGATAFLELGPGRVLSDMAAATYPPFPARSVEDFHSIDGVRHWLYTVVRRSG